MPVVRIGVGLAFTGAAAAAIAAAMYRLLPVGYDFYHWYRPIPLAWLAGETRLYDEASRGFFPPPWILWLLVPFALPEIRWGMAALALSSLAVVAGVSYHYGKAAGAGRPWLPALLAVLCPYSLNGILVGTFDAWSLLGLYGAYLAIPARRPWLLGGALVLATAKPQDVLLTLPVLLLELRHWPGALVARAATIPLAVFVSSLLVFGLDWPLRWLENYRAVPPGGYAGSSGTYLVTSTYAATNLGGIPLPLVAAGALMLAAYVLRHGWKQGVRPDTLDLAAAANAVVSPHMLSQEYVLLLALPWTRLAVRRPWVAAALYAVSLPVWFRAGGLWDRLGLLDVTFPMLLLVVVLLLRGYEAISAGGSSPAERGGTSGDTTPSVCA